MQHRAKQTEFQAFEGRSIVTTQYKSIDRDFRDKFDGTDRADRQNCEREGANKDTRSLRVSNEEVIARNSNRYNYKYKYEQNPSQ